MKKHRLKICGILLCVTLLAALAIAGPRIRANEDITRATGEFASGSGTASDPYIITNKNHLNNMRKYLDAHYRLDADIIFEDADFAEGGAFYNNGAGWEPIGTTKTPFTGTFNGNNHTITGLTMGDLGQSALEEFASGDGTQENPYIITNSKQLDNVRRYLNSWFELGADITFTEADFALGGKFYNNGEGWEPIGSKNFPFTGNFDGKGHTITGLVISKSTSSNTYAGLFGCNENVIANVKMANSQISVAAAMDSVYSYVGSIAGENAGTITGCTVAGSLSGTYAGGIAGSNRGTVTQCSNAGTVTGTYAGGIASTNAGTVNDTDNAGAINGQSLTGGIVGSNGKAGTVTNCENTGEISGGNDIGGIAGNNAGQVKTCNNTAAVSGTSNVGGIVGNSTSTGTILSGVNAGAVSGTDNVGGVAGNSDYSIKQCSNTGAVSGENNIGGIAGENNQNARMESCSNTGTVTGTGEYAGGIAGYNDTGAQITASHNTAAISGKKYVGGIAGSNNRDGVIINCGNTARITASNDNAGGVAAKNVGSVQLCYNLAAISGKRYAGGIAGNNESGSAVENCYNAAPVSATQFAGGIAGGSGGTVTLCYNAGGVSVQTGSAVGGIVGSKYGGTVDGCFYLDNTPKGLGSGTDTTTKCTLAQLQQQDAFTGWDFDTVWTLENSQNYPYPQLISNQVQWNLTPSSLTLLKEPEKLQYKEKEELDVTGGMLRVTFDNGLELDVTLQEDMVSGYHKNQAGKQTLTVTYQNKTVKFSVEVAHIYTSVVTKPGCATAGYTTHTCSGCGHTYKDSNVPATGQHKWSTSVTKATTSQNGKIVQTCSGCQKTTTTAISYPKTFSLSTTNYTYSGGVKTPTVTVKDATGKTLGNGTDYTVTYASGRKNVGTYTVKVTMKGNYTGTKTLTFKINPISISACSVKLSTTSYTYNGKVKTPSVTVKDASGTKLTRDTHYTVSYASGRKNAGTYTVKVTMKGNYTGTKTLTFKINPISISKCTAKLSYTSYTYNGKVRTPTVTVKNAGGTTLTKNTHYTVSYASGRKNVGSYTVKVTMKGNYSGTKTLTFKINPPKTTVSKLTAGNNSFTATISKKTSQVSGYQVQYATSQWFTSATTKTLSGTSSTKLTVKKLKDKKTYYVRVRTYKTVNGTKYYSGWSDYKSVKTK